MNAVSVSRLATCHPELVRLFKWVDLEYPCLVLEGHRGEAAQNAAFDGGKSQLRWPNGKHNSLPSLAVDVCPLPVEWDNLKAFYHFGGYVRGVARSIGIRVRWGGDWDGDLDFKDQSFNDLVHFELVLPPPTPGVVTV